VCNGAKDPRKGLEQLSALGQRLVIRAYHLPADLALLGLLEDLRGAASAVLALSESAPSFTIYPPTRTVFEATQRIIALATDDDLPQGWNARVALLPSEGRGNSTH
jgi:hypothetical protein